MEAVLVKNKEKKHRKRLQQSSETGSASVADDLNSAKSLAKNKGMRLKEAFISEVPNNYDVSATCLPKSLNKSETYLDDNITEKQLQDSNISCDQNKCDKICDKLTFENSCITSESVSDVVSQNININRLADTSEVRESLPKNELGVNSPEIVLQHMYPDLRCIQQMQNIISSQTLVKTYAAEYHVKTVSAANKGYHNFMEVNLDIDKHPFKELIHQYQTSKKSCNQLCSKLKYLKSDLKRKNDSLWRSVRKEASAKGQCEDGCKVNVVHSYVIKELDQDKFYNVIKILKEIEDSVPLAAFNCYSEELLKLRIEHYILNLTSGEKSGISKESVDSSFSSIKQCVSILFNCQRQNFLDKSYLETCQLWLRKLVTTLILNGKFDDNLFIINHVLRCPNGIKNWASSFVQVPVDMCASETKQNFDCPCAYRILLALYLILNPIPLREIFLKNIEDAAFSDSIDTGFAVLDSEGEEEEILQMAKRWSDADIVSLLNQIPLTKLFKHLLLDSTNNTESLIKVHSEERILKFFAYSTVAVDILFTAFGTYSLEDYPNLFEFISNTVRHILLYVSDYWIQHANTDSNKSQIQAVYERWFFQVVFKIFCHEKFGIWKILPALPYKCISKTILWNIIWIFYAPGKSENDVYLEKDVERKIKDDSVQDICIKNLKNCSSLSVIHLLNTFENISLSSSGDEDLLNFIILQVYKITFVETEFRGTLHNEGAIILASIVLVHPYLLSVLIKEIDKNEEDVVNLSISTFKKLNIKNWIPENEDLTFISCWLLSNPLTGAKNHLARLLLKNLNWGFKQGSLFLPYELHQKIGLLVVEAYMKFDANSDEWMVSRGVKQLLQFASVGNPQREDEGFIQWAWHIMFSLKLHPLDQIIPSWISIYDGGIEDYFKSNAAGDLSLDSLLSAFENNHPSACYLMLVMTEAGLSASNIKTSGLKCFFSLIKNQQYLAAIKSLYYILPFFVKNCEQLLEHSEFIKAIRDLLMADMTIMSSITGETVIGAVLTEIATMIKYQISQAMNHTVECAAPLIKLWIKILLKVTNNEKTVSRKGYAKQVHFLLDAIAKISFTQPYTRDCMSDLLSTFCHTLFMPKFSSQTSFLKRMLFSNPSVYNILNRTIIPEYPWIAWFVLSAELKQEYVQDLWSKVQEEVLKSDVCPESALKKISDQLKIDKPPVEFLPIYRWALQAVSTPISHPVCPLFWQQFFIYYFHRLSLPDSQGFTSIGRKYFQNGQQLSLFEKIKTHLIEAKRYYKDCLKNLDSECVSSTHDTVQDKGKPDVQFYVNILKLFEAFILWISDESLHKSELCLSALDPKYCLYHLELILKRDQNIWFDMVLLMPAKDDIDYKNGYWNMKSTSVLSYEQSHHNEESLPEKLLRHIENYETVEPLENNAIIPEAFIMDETVLSSWETLGNIIEQIQNIIFKKAKCFAEQFKELKQINFNFINWVPQEYEVADCEVTQNKVCHKGHHCSGAACFKLKIQKYSKNDRISELIYRNRADYLILQDRLSKLPVNDLCVATLQIENFIRTLADRMKSAKNEEAAHLRKMGVSFFYHQINSIDKLVSSVAEYPPSRHFFSSVIESLGREFIEGDDSQLLDLAKSILSHPESGSFALPLFNLNKCSISNFLTVYEILTSSVGSCSESTLLALFSKIELSVWLKESAPPYSCRREIFKHTCNAFQLCGFTPSEELLPIFEILRKHFRILLLYMFPELFPESVYFLLNGIESKVCIDIYYETFHCFGCPLFNNETTIEDIKISLKKFTENQLLPVNQQIFISLAQLNLKQVKNTCILLSRQFSVKLSCCNLYKNYPEYIKPLGIFIALINHSLIALYLDDNMIQEQALCTSDLWKTFHLSFCPWLHPTVTGTNFTFPWSENEMHVARYMFQIFVICMTFFQEQLAKHNSEESVLSYLWNYYVEVYVSPGYRHYLVSLSHSEFLQLPWHEFHPTPHDVDGMCKVLQSSLPESKEFLSKISLRIPWSKVLNDTVQTKSSDYVGKVLNTLGRLIIISQFNSVEVENNLYPSIFKELENLPWHYLSVEDTEELLNLFYSKCDSLLILQCVQKNTDIPAFQFLKWACCMVPTINTDEYTNFKRILYLQKFKSAFNDCVINKKVRISKEVDNFKTFFPILLNEIDVICKGVNHAEQMKFAMPLVKEIILFLNNFSMDKLEAIAMKSITSWLTANPRSPLILPCLKVSSSFLNSVVTMVPLIECCINARFNDEVHDSHEVSTTWAVISSCFCIASKFSKDFIQKCIEENAFLSLYCYIQHRQPHFNSKEQKEELIKLVFKWIRESDLSSQAEAKFLLLWDKVLELSIALVLQGNLQVVQQELLSFCWKLEKLSEDRSNSGFFATFGLGQASSLSVNFRFLCRVLTAFLLCQIPDNCRMRIEPMDCGHVSSVSTNRDVKDSQFNQIPSPSKYAITALENLKALQQKRSYAALQSHVDYAVKFVLDPNYNLSDSRKLLKYFAMLLFPKESYVLTIDS